MVFRRLVTYGEEDVYGEAPEDVSKWVGGVTSFNGGAELVGEKVAVLTGGRGTWTAAHGVDVSPSISFYPQTAQFLKYAFGKTTNTGASQPYTHVLEVSEGYELPSVSLLEHRLGAGGHGYLYTGCRADKLVLSWEADGLLKASMDFKALRATKTTTLPTPTPDTRDYFKASSKTVEINGVQVGYVVSGSVTVSNNHVAFPRSGDFVTRHVAGLAEAEAELELFYVDSSILELMLGKTRFDVRVRFSRGSQDYLELLLQDCVCSVEAELPAEGELMQTVSLKPAGVKITAVDDIPAY
jgi:hypothetical protein